MKAIFKDYPRARGYFVFIIFLIVLIFIMICENFICDMIPGLRINLIVILIWLIIALIIIGFKFSKFNDKSEQKEESERPKEFSDIGVRAWKRYLEIDKLLHDRVNYFLVAESMLLVAFVTAYTMSENLLQIKPALAFVGVVITLIWYYSNRRIRLRINYFYNIAWKNDPDIYDYRRAIRISPTEEFMITTLLPNSILLLWLYLYSFSMRYNMRQFMELWLPISISLLVSLFLIIELTLPPEGIKNFLKVLKNFLKEFKK